MILEDGHCGIDIEELPHSKLVDYGIVVSGFKDTWRDPWLSLALITGRGKLSNFSYLKYKPPSPGRQLIIINPSLNKFEHTSLLRGLCRCHN